MAAFTVSEFPHHLHLEFLIRESANAFSLEAARELAGLRRRYARWTKPVVVASAHPRLFCSGGNLSDYKKLKSRAAGLKVNREIAAHLKAFAAWPATKLALIDGDVLGGGMEWLACFDGRWCTPASLFSFWQRRIGLSPGWGGGARWAERIGEGRVQALVREARVLSAPHALRLGLVDQVICAWKIRETVVEWAAANADGFPRWTARNEAQLFASLWLGPRHKAILGKW